MMDSSDDQEVAEPSNNEDLLTINGFEDEIYRRDRIHDAINDERITRLQINNVNCWDAELHYDIERWSCSRLNEIVIRGGQLSRYSDDLSSRTLSFIRDRSGSRSSLTKIHLERFWIDPTCKIRYDKTTLKELSLSSLSLSSCLLESLRWHLSSSDTHENNDDNHDNDDNQQANDDVGSCVLEYIDLTNSGLNNASTNDKEAFVAMFRSNTSLENICLSECNLTDEVLVPVISSLRHNPSITNLDLSFNKCQSETIWELARPQTCLTTCLRNLNLGFIAFGAGRQIDLKPLFRSLIESPPQHQIDISSNIRFKPFKSFTSTLTTLQLGGNSLRDPTMKDITVMLKQNQTLERLDLSENRFTNVGVRFLADCFESHDDENEDYAHATTTTTTARPGLRFLNLEDNRFNEDGVSMLADAMEFKNCKIESIVIGETLSKTPYGRRLMYHLDLNWSGHKKLLMMSQPLPSLIRRIRCRTDTADTAADYDYIRPILPLILERANNGPKQSGNDDEDYFQRKPCAEDIVYSFLKTWSSFLIR
ncbi:MAG: hypothetical protein ACI8RD_010081 [Bacillariaceae sp.]|jgi:hypothetical protein